MRRKDPVMDPQKIIEIFSYSDLQSIGIYRMNGTNSCKTDTSGLRGVKKESRQLQNLVHRASALELSKIHFLFMWQVIPQTE